MKVAKVIIDIREIRLAFDLPTDCEIEIEETVGVAMEEEQQEAEFTTNHKREILEPSDSERKRAIKMIQDGVKTKKIHEATGLPKQWIYQQKHRMGKDGTLVALDTDHEEEPKPFIQLKAHLTGHPSEQKIDNAKELEVIDDQWYADKIRQAWVVERKSSLDVCNELDISMMRFNKLIMAFNIKRG